jgi:hypothetical protein
LTANLADPHDPTKFGRLDVRAVATVEGDFFVPSYQRGYRWTTLEVTALLDDVRESDGATYYLQPVVVKSRNNGSWELVDGQQRLTTLYLILKYLHRNHLPSVAVGYTISYETRPGSATYLEELDGTVAETNIDYFHMHRAYQAIEDWFDRQGAAQTNEALRLYQALFESVKVLWYQAPPDVDPRDLFTRLNVGRIPLTDGELVKALLLSHSQSAGGRTDRSIEVAAHWDAIERDLRRPELWAFVTGSPDEEATHISLLLDTLAGVPRNREAHQFQTFEKLRAQIQSDAAGFWSDVVQLHSLVLGWFEDRSLFHKVGYLIAVGRTFAELHELSRDKGRSAFEAALDEQIRLHLQLTAGELADLGYGDDKASDVLLLMNVETVRDTPGSTERYSFRAHASRNWSLEHIHAQNAEQLRTSEQRRAWLVEHRNALDGLDHLGEDERAALAAQIDELLSTEVTAAAFGPVEQKVVGLFTGADDAAAADVHSIANLALLDSGDNAALSNSVFEVKRRRVIQRDKDGSYIPVCTRNVFLKYYTEVPGQFAFWSATDRAAYLDAVRGRVAAYLQPDEDGDR